MIVLTTAAFLMAVGFALFIVGWLFGFRGIAVIGGVIVLGVGVMVTSGGLQYKTGESETQLPSGDVVTTNQYSTTELPTHLSLGLLLMLAGAVFVFRGLYPEGG